MKALFEKRPESLREPHDAKEEAEWWRIWATHHGNDATVQETCQTFGLGRTAVWRILQWCAWELHDGNTDVLVTEGLVFQKKVRLRRIRATRDACMDRGEHMEAIGYLRMERDLERDIAELEGALVHRISLEGNEDAPLVYKFEHVAPDEAAELVREALSGDSGQPDGGSGAEE